MAGPPAQCWWQRGSRRMPQLWASAHFFLPLIAHLPYLASACLPAFLPRAGVWCPAAAAHTLPGCLCCGAAAAGGGPPCCSGKGAWQGQATGAGTAAVPQPRRLSGGSSALQAAGPGELAADGLLSWLVHPPACVPACWLPCSPAALLTAAPLTLPARLPSPACHLTLHDKCR